PSIINRQRQQTADRRDPPRLTPEIAIIPYLVEFPDSYARELSAARLYVDGALAVEKTAGPFEHFQWLLTNYEESGSHVLQVEVEDELGLVARSIETIVQVEVEPIRLSLFDRFLATGWAPVFAGIGLAGVILILALVIAGRKTAHAVHNQPKIRRKGDPLVQEVAIRQEQPARGRRVVHKAQPATVPRLPDYAQAPAFLVRISESGHPLPSSRIALARKETTFGSDPQQAITVLESPSVDALHARLYYTPEQGYMLVDAGSVAGTWVNFAPVSGAGVRLEHGDLVHIGRIGFRFELSQPQTVRQAIVVPYREE
ncbi:MAG: FHA domain-containing protein, partial [Anaerolineaceae bacterium]